jgi:hypothetical protein
MTRVGVVGLAWLSIAPAAETPAAEHRFTASQLLAVRRVHVEKMGGGETAQHVRDMVIASLQRSGLFLLTENPEKADAILRGSAEDLVFTDTFQSSESLNARVSAGVPGTNSSKTTSRRYLSAGVGESESTRIAERKHEAAAAVRLVNREGDVIWSTTQESLGAKFRGASADVADKITRQLVEDFRRAKLDRGLSSVNPNPFSR